MVDLVFGPEVLDSKARAEAGKLSQPPELWTIPAVRYATAALLDRYSAAIAGSQASGISRFEEGGQSGDPREGEVSAGDVQRWAEQFVASSFGDPLFAAMMAWSLQLWQSPTVQVTSAMCSVLWEVACGYVIAGYGM